MDDILSLDIIINRKKYPCIYNTSLIITIILLIFIYIIFTYKYQTYYITKGKMTNNELELLVNTNDLKYLYHHNMLSIDNKNYSYNLISISDEIYLDDSYNDYKYVYLKIDNLTNIDNYVYEIKIEKENKLLAEYLKEYL